MNLVQALGEQLGKDKVFVGEEILAKYLSDASLLPPTVPVALVRPTSTSDVSATLRLCNAERWPIVIQGGLTGLVGGAHPCQSARNVDPLSASNIGSDAVLVVMDFIPRR